MSIRLRALLEAVVIGGLLVGGVYVENGRGGVEALYVALALLLVGPAVRRLLVLRGRALPAPPIVFVCELASFTGLLKYPLGEWALPAAGLATLLLALSEAPPPGNVSPRGAWLDEVPTLGLVAVTSLVLWISASGKPVSGRGQVESYAVMILLAGVGLEAWGPRSRRTPSDAGRRAASLALLAASGWLEAGFHPYVLVDAEHVFLLLAAVAIIPSCLEACERPAPEGAP